MKRVHLSAVALLLAVTTSAWAAVEPYPAAVQAEDAPAMTRAEVAADLHEAQRLGLLSNVESDFPYAGAAVRSEHTFGAGDARAVRAKMHAETVEAGRLGILSFGEGDPPVATVSQEELIATAGRNAVDALRVADGMAKAVIR